MIARSRPVETVHLKIWDGRDEMISALASLADHGHNGARANVVHTRTAFTPGPHTVRRRWRITLFIVTELVVGVLAISVAVMRVIGQ